MTEKTSLTTTNIQVFYPSWEEFQNFTKYVESIECQDAQKGGIAKIIPPPEWTHKNPDLDNLNLNIPKPILQKSKGKDGVYVQSAKIMKSMTVCEFKQLAESDRYNAPTMSIPDLENKYWKEKNKTTAIYGADVSGTLFSNELKEWNMNSLGSILDIINDYGTNIEGVNTPFLYFGMYKSTFAWHTEDMDLYSLNYVHMGAAKQWYSISPKHGRKFESLVKKLFLDSFETCPAFLRHKTVLLSPNILETHSIPYNKIVQEPGEFIITFPFAYHSGFNYGFNCAEAINFAMPRWIDYGIGATLCYCSNTNVHISMKAFVERFQPTKYSNWLSGNDDIPHPEAIKRSTPKLQNFSSHKKKIVRPKRNLEHPEIVAKEVLSGKRVHNEEFFLEKKFINSYKGFGVFAKRDIMPGAFLCEYKGEIITQKEAVKRQRRKGPSYLFFFYAKDGKCRCIDGEVGGSIASFINDDKKLPNSISRMIYINNMPRICLFARKESKINQGDEIVYSYGQESDLMYWRQGKENPRPYKNGTCDDYAKTVTRSVDSQRTTCSAPDCSMVFDSANDFSISSAADSPIVSSLCDSISSSVDNVLTKSTTTGVSNSFDSGLVFTSNVSCPIAKVTASCSDIEPITSCFETVTFSSNRHATNNDGIHSTVVCSTVKSVVTCSGTKPQAIRSDDEPIISCSSIGYEDLNDTLDSTVVGSAFKSIVHCFDVEPFSPHSTVEPFAACTSIGCVAPNHALDFIVVCSTVKSIVTCHGKPIFSCSEPIASCSLIKYVAPRLTHDSTVTWSTVKPIVHCSHVEPLATSPDVEPPAPSPDVEPLAPSPDVEPPAPSPDVEPSAPSPDFEPPAPSPDVEPLAPSPDVEPPAPNPDVEPPAPSPDVEPPSPSPDVEPPAPSTDFDPPAPSPYVEPPTPIPDVEPPAPIPDVEPPAPSPDVEPPAPSPDVEPLAPGPDDEPFAPIPHVKLLALSSDVEPIAVCSLTGCVAPNYALDSTVGCSSVKSIVPCSDVELSISSIVEPIAACSSAEPITACSSVGCITPNYAFDSEVACSATVFSRPVCFKNVSALSSKAKENTPGVVSHENTNLDLRRICTELDTLRKLVKQGNPREEKSHELSSKIDVIYEQNIAIMKYLINTHENRLLESHQSSAQQNSSHLPNNVSEYDGTKTGICSTTLMPPVGLKLNSSAIDYSIINNTVTDSPRVTNPNVEFAIIVSSATDSTVTSSIVESYPFEKNHIFSTATSTLNTDLDSDSSRPAPKSHSTLDSTIVYSTAGCSTDVSVPLTNMREKKLTGTYSSVCSTNFKRPLDMQGISSSVASPTDVLVTDSPVVTYPVVDFDIIVSSVADSPVVSSIVDSKSSFVANTVISPANIWVSSNSDIDSEIMYSSNVYFATAKSTVSCSNVESIASCTSTRYVASNVALNSTVVCLAASSSAPLCSVDVTVPLSNVEEKELNGTYSSVCSTNSKRPLELQAISSSVASPTDVLVTDSPVVTYPVVDFDIIDSSVADSPVVSSIVDSTSSFVVNTVISPANIWVSSNSDTDSEMMYSSNVYFATAKSTVSCSNVESIVSCTSTRYVASNVALDSTVVCLAASSSAPLFSEDVTVPVSNVEEKEVNGTYSSVCSTNSKRPLELQAISSSVASPTDVLVTDSPVVIYPVVDFDIIVSSVADSPVVSSIVDSTSSFVTNTVISPANIWVTSNSDIDSEIMYSSNDYFSAAKSTVSCSNVESIASCTSTRYVASSSALDSTVDCLAASSSTPLCSVDVMVPLSNVEENELNATENMDASDFVDYLPPEKKQKKTSVRPCPFCHCDKTLLKRHIKNVHKNEEEVKEILKLEPFDQKLKFDLLRKRGIDDMNMRILRENATTNEKKELISERKGTSNRYKRCPMCRGYFVPKCYSVHLKRCKKIYNSSEVLDPIKVSKETGYLLANDEVSKIKYSPRFLTTILERFHDDEIGNLCRTDPLLKYIGYYIYMKRSEDEDDPRKQKTYHVKKDVMGKMRILAKFSLKMREICASNISLQDMFNRNLMPQFQEAIKEALGVRVDARCQFGYIFVQAIKILQSRLSCLKKEQDGKEMKEFLNALVNPINWVPLFGRQENYASIKSTFGSRKPSNLPKEDHLRTLYKYVSDTLISVTRGNFNPKNYVTLRRALLTRLTFLNARRGGEPCILLKSQWDEALNDEWLNQDFLKAAIQNEMDDRQMLSEFKICFQKGKGFKSVSIMVPKDCVKAMNILCNKDVREEAGIHPLNKYVFATKSNSPDAAVQGVSDLNAIISQLNLPLQAKGMRHYMSTKQAAMQLSDDARRLFYLHMGHDESINKQNYQSELVAERVMKVGKILKTVDNFLQMGEQQNFASADSSSTNIIDLKIAPKSIATQKLKSRTTFSVDSNSNYNESNCSLKNSSDNRHLPSTSTNIIDLKIAPKSIATQKLKSRTTFSVDSNSNYNESNCSLKNSSDNRHLPSTSTCIAINSQLTNQSIISPPPSCSEVAGSFEECATASMAENDSLLIPNGEEISRTVFQMKTPDKIQSSTSRDFALETPSPSSSLSECATPFKVKRRRISLQSLALQKSPSPSSSLSECATPFKVKTRRMSLESLALQRQRITWTPNSIRAINNFPLFQKYLVNLSPKGAKGPVAKNWEIDKFLERHALFPDKDQPLKRNLVRRKIFGMRQTNRRRYFNQMKHL